MDSDLTSEITKMKNEFTKKMFWVKYLVKPNTDCHTK